MENVNVIPIANNKKEIKRFIKFAWEIYKGNKYWVSPLIADKVKFITKGPYHEVGIMQPYLAYRNGKIVGRIIAHYDKRHNEYYNEKRGCIGFFESINDKQVSRALFTTAEKWLKEQGMEEIHGPMNFLIYDESGLLLDNYDSIPVIECAYSQPYYPELFEDYGFQKTTDWYSYIFTHEQKIPKLFLDAKEKVLKKNEFTFRNGNVKNFDEERKNIQAIFNNAWKKNWGHYPLTDGQFSSFANDLKMVIKEELLIIAEKDGDIAGFILSIPDANIALKRAKGRLFPFGMLKILLSLRKIDKIKTILMGVLPQYRMRGLEVFFIAETVERAKKMGYKESDCSLVVETNTDMINSLNHLGAKVYKTYRFYKKTVE